MFVQAGLYGGHGLPFTHWLTTFSLVAGMLPLALGTGPGAEERRTIAVVIIGGQTLSLILTLIVTPVVYSLMDDATQKVKQWTGFATDSTTHGTTDHATEPSSCATDAILHNTTE